LSDDLAISVVAQGQRLTLTCQSGKVNDGRGLGLSVNFRKKEIGLCLLKVTGSLDRWQLERVALEENRHAERKQVFDHGLRDHAEFVDHKQGRRTQRAIHV